MERLSITILIFDREIHGGDEIITRASIQDDTILFLDSLLTVDVRKLFTGRRQLLGIDMNQAVIVPAQFDLESLLRLAR